LPEIREVECPEDTEDEIILLPHPEECIYYFICLNGYSVLMRCGRSMLFDYIQEACYFEDRAVCFDQRIPLTWQ